MASSLVIRWRWVAALGVVALLGLMVYLNGRGDVAIVEVWSFDDGLGLEIILDTCNADVTVDVEESNDRLVVHAKNHEWHLFVTGGDDCQDAVRVILEQPLGDRIVTDAKGDQLVVIPR